MAKRDKQKKPVDAEKEKEKASAPVSKETKETVTKMEEEPKTEVASTPISSEPAVPKAPMTSLFSKSSRKKFARPETPAQPIEETASKEEKKKPIDKHANDDRTLFVGNLPTEIIAKPGTLKKAFSVFGDIDTLRFRSVSVESTPITSFNKKLLKKAAVIQKKLSDDKKSVNAYIVYKNAESVQKALSLNNTVLLERHIVVDTVGKKAHKDKDANSRTLFVGNLPFNCDEEDLRNFFDKHIQEQKTRNGITEKETMVESVRLIRAKDTQKGKGIGYVVLKSAVYVPLALMVNKAKFGDRELRVTRYLSNPEAIEKQKERDAIRNGRKGKKGKKTVVKEKKVSPQVAGAAKRVLEMMKAGKDEKVPEKKEKKEKKEKPVEKKEKPVEKKSGEKSTPKIDLSFMGHKSSISASSLHSAKRLMKPKK